MFVDWLLVSLIIFIFLVALKVLYSFRITRYILYMSLGFMLGAFYVLDNMTCYSKLPDHLKGDPIELKRLEKAFKAII